MAHSAHIGHLGSEIAAASILDVEVAVGDAADLASAAGFRLVVEMDDAGTTPHAVASDKRARCIDRKLDIHYMPEHVGP